MTIRVLLADDHPLTRAGLSAYLQKETGIELVGEAEDGIAAWDLVSKLRPDVALLDIRMPGADGVTVARQIKEAGLPVAVIMLTSYDAQQYVLASLRAGAKGFVLKTVTPDNLARAIQTVARGGLYLDPEVASDLFISERTVQTHLASIYDKLGARNKTEALLLALKYGVVTLEELLE